MPMYGSENWALSRCAGRELETVEMRYLRRVSGYTFTDHVRNPTIRNALQIHALEARILDSNK